MYKQATDTGRYQFTKFSKQFPIILQALIYRNLNNIQRTINTPEGTHASYFK